MSCSLIGIRFGELLERSETEGRIDMVQFIGGFLFGFGAGVCFNGEEARRSFAGVKGLMDAVLIDPDDLLERARDEVHQAWVQEAREL